MVHVTVVSILLHAKAKAKAKKDPNSLDARIGLVIAKSNRYPNLALEGLRNGGAVDGRRLTFTASYAPIFELREWA